MIIEIHEVEHFQGLVNALIFHITQQKGDIISNRYLF